MVFRENTYSVLLVSASEKFNSNLKTLLPSSDYWPVVEAASISAARRTLAEQSFDIIFINSPLPDDFGLQFAIDACGSGNAGVLILVKSELYNEIYYKSLEYGVITLSKPTTAAVIEQALHILCATRERLRRMEEKQASVNNKIEEIRLVNRAKWVLIENLKMTEPDANRYIEKQAMDRRVPKKQIAENIIKLYQQ